MIQGWRRYGEVTGVQEGDTVTIEMIDDTVLLVTVERTGTGRKPPRSRQATAAASNASAHHHHYQQQQHDRQLGRRELSAAGERVQHEL